MRCFAALIFASTVVSVTAVRGDDAGVEFFEKKIRPVLVEQCQQCHSTNSKKPNGGLLLDHRDGLRKGGDSGAAFVAGKPDESLLMTAIRYEDDSLKMPPKGKLPASVIADFETWIKRGAVDPRDKPSGSAADDEPWEQTMRRRADWWSLKPVGTPAVPTPKNAEWSQQPVDRFLLAKLEEQGLTPAAAADPRTLARRLSLVLTGLPPTTEQVNAFVRDCGSAAPGEPLPAPAVEKFVDMLLISPHFGERWARHWLDVVHFTETHGNEWNYEVHHAWRYRDYVIRALNADVPYDQFIREQIAGDLLPKPRMNNAEHFNESVIGTGCFRFGEVNHDDCIGLRQIGFDLADNQIDTLTKAFQATTVACARCHNHKLDAISTDDYYALLGVIRSTRLVSHSIDAPEVNAPQIQKLRELKVALRKELAAVWLADVQQFPRYMQAAAARRAKRPDAEELANGLDPARLEKWQAVLATESLPLEDPLEIWRRLAVNPDLSGFAAEWERVAAALRQESQSRTQFNRMQFETFADFRRPDVRGWQSEGRGLADGPSRPGEFVLWPEGDVIVKSILPEGRYTHALSEKLNGAWRSPVIPLGKKYISFQVLGQRSSAVRLVSNNCQLNYKNYKALISADLHWETFSPPEDRDALRTYAELMTMFDNPKFPDQLSALGGDKDNYRLPWEKAAENPRSYFGVTRAVLHDGPEPPKTELHHVLSLLSDKAPQSLDELASRYVSTVSTVLDIWRVDRVTDDGALWLEPLRKHGLLSNGRGLSPQCDALLAEYRQVESTLSVPRVVAGVADVGPGADQPVFVRGDCLKPGATVPRRYLEVLSQTSGAGVPAAQLERFKSPGSGRLELAERIASPDNPLTARVMVNRVWHHLFGTGLVRTVDDFGHVGELPSHPELLDHLARRFVEEGWSVKRLIRTLLLTRAFQASNEPSPAARERDPQNRLLQHYPARRMEAEAVRDSILFASGRLDRTLFGPSVQPFRDKEYADRRLFPGPLDGNGRRSVYIKNNLMEAPKFLAAFNFPGGKVTQGRRDVTNVPAQALALLNDPFVLQQADVWAQRLVLRQKDTVTARIDAMFESALNRPPSKAERERFEQTVLQLAELHGVKASGRETNGAGDEVLRSQPVWKDVAHTLLNVSEFIYIP